MSRNNFWKIIITLMIFVGLLVVGWFFVRNKPIEENKKQNQSQIQTQETSDWETYRNEEYGYLVKYPMGWSIDSTDQNDVILGNIGYEPSPGYFEIKAEPIVKNSNYNFSENKLDYSKFADEFRKKFPDGCDKSKRVVISDDITAQKITCIEPFAAQELENYFIENDGVLYHINWIKGTDEFEEINLIFNKILFSFKFIAPESNTTKTNPSLILVYPNGGENLYINGKYTVRWLSKNIPANETVHLYYGQKNKWLAHLGQTSNSGIHETNIASNVSPGSDYVFVIKSVCSEPQNENTCVIEDESDKSITVSFNDRDEFVNNLKILYEKSQEFGKNPDPEYSDMKYRIEASDLPPENENVDYIPGVFNIIEDGKIVDSFEGNIDNTYIPVHEVVSEGLGGPVELLIVSYCKPNKIKCTGELDRYSFRTKELAPIIKNTSDFYMSSAEKTDYMVFFTTEDFKNYKIFVYNFSDGAIISQPLNLECYSDDDTRGKGCADVFVYAYGELVYLPIDYWKINNIRHNNGDAYSLITALNSNIRKVDLNEKNKLTDYVKDIVLLHNSYFNPVK